MTAASAPGEPAIDAAINHPTRLAVVAFLSACDEAEFATVRGSCQVSDSMLSKVASALEGIGYLAIRKGYVGKRPGPGSPSHLPGVRPWPCMSRRSRASLPRPGGQARRRTRRPGVLEADHLA